MSPLTINLLGSFQVQRAGALVTRFRGDKVRALLAYLAVEPDQPFTRSALAGLLWPEQPEAQALRNLSQALIRLGEALGELPFEVTRQAIRWRPDAAEVDVRVFSALVGSSETTDLAQAAALYRGELLAGFSLPECEAFEEWLLIARERLLQQALVALHSLAEQHLAAGRLAHAAAIARRQLELDVWREAAHRQLMRALALGGDRGAALAQYASCCQALESGLGVEPDDTTHALYEQIRSNQLQIVDFRLQIDQKPNLQSTIYNLQSHEWSEVPEAGRFYGRQAEIAQITTWLLDQRCQLVAILGIGGMGKTSLAATVAQAVAERFEHVIWRSLVNAPPLDELLRPLLQTLTGQALTNLPTSLDDQLALLLDYLRKQRCLLVFDNFESLLDADSAGRMRAGYDGYAQLLDRLARSRHQSCLLITSRERSQGMARWEDDLAWVRALRLEGLDPAASQAILSARGLDGQAAEASALIARYSGHPLALKLVAETVRELFGGAIGAFLREDSLFFDDIRAMLDQQFARLSPLEQEILFWLAIEREPVAAAALRDNLVRKPVFGQFLEALRALQRRSLLEQQQASFTLPNVVAEYLIARLIDGVCDELLGVGEQLGARGDQVTLARFVRLNRFALLKAQAKEYVRQSQARLILQPLAERLVGKLGTAALADRIRRILEALRATAPRAPGYAGGNLLNLLLQLGIDPSGYDFSRLSIWQADLRGVASAALNLAQADLTACTFTVHFSAFALRYDASGHVLVAAPFRNTISIWRVANGQVFDGVRMPNEDGYPIILSPDGQFLAGCCPDLSVRIWSVADGRILHILRGHALRAHALAFSASSDRLASASPDNTICLWDVRSGECTRILHQPLPPFATLAFQPPGEGAAEPALLACAGTDHTIWLWDLRSGHVVDILHGHLREIECLAFAPDRSLLASGSHDGSILLWSVRHSSQAALLGTLHGHSGLVRALVFGHDSQLLASASTDHSIRLWDVRAGQTRQILSGHADEVAHLSFHPDGHALASAGVDRVIKLWDVQSGRPLDSLTGYSMAIRAVCFRPDGQLLASGSADGVIRLWDRDTGRLTRSFQAHPGQVVALAWSHNGTFLASGGTDGSIRLWDATSATLVQTLRGHTGSVKSVAWRPDDRMLASGSADRTIRLWPLVEGANHVAEQGIRLLYGHTDEVAAVMFDHDGRRLLSGSHDHSMRVWAVESAQEIRQLPGHTTALSAAAFSPDGRHVGSICYGGQLQLCDVETGSPSIGWSAIDTIGRVVGFNPRGDLLVHGSEDIALTVRERSTGTVLHTLRGHTSTIVGLDFSLSEPVIASSGWDGTIRLWNLETGACLHTLRAPGPYAGMNIAGVTGISDAQKAALRALGAVEEA